MRAGWAPALLGFTAVALGAFGAHGLKPLLEERGTADIWQTAVLYHLVHAVAALWASHTSRRALAMWCAGIAIFSGSLYALALTGARWLGAVTPIGGVLLLAGWAACAWSAPPAGSSPQGGSRSRTGTK